MEPELVELAEFRSPDQLPESRRLRGTRGNRGVTQSQRGPQWSRGVSGEIKGQKETYRTNGGYQGAHRVTEGHTESQGVT